MHLIGGIFVPELGLEKGPNKFNANELPFSIEAVPHVYVSPVSWEAAHKFKLPHLVEPTVECYPHPPTGHQVPRGQVRRRAPGPARRRRRQLVRPALHERHVEDVKEHLSKLVIKRPVRLAALENCDLVFDISCCKEKPYYLRGESCCE